jgi:hypothetical protein
MSAHNRAKREANHAGFLRTPSKKSRMRIGNEAIPAEKARPRPKRV